MKRRKWWLIALSLTLLAACAGMWRWSERPPYRFMEGAELLFVYHRTGPGETDCTLEFTSERPAAELVALAEKELGSYPIGGMDGQKWFSGGISPPANLVSIASATTEVVDYRSAVLGPNVPPLKGVRTLIEVWREPTVLNRLHAWLHGLRWKVDHQ